MKAAEIVNLLNNYLPGHSLEQAFYTSEDIFHLDRELIWKKYWLFAGVTAEIPKEGDYITYAVGHDSVIIIRGREGKVHAHFNTCRHRGSTICQDEKGHAPKLMCPYHQWVYNTDGSLFKARLMPDDFDRASYGLHPVHIRLIEGLIFISLAEDPVDFDSVVKDLAPYVKPYQIDQSKVAFKKSYTIRTNWKLIAENFRECYHCGPAHPEYCKAVVGANLRESIDDILVERRASWKNKGLVTEGVDFQTDTFHFATRYPLRDGVESYSLDGKAVAIPMGAHKDYDAGVVGLVCYPNFWMDAVGDYVWTMRITAESASQCRIDLTWLVDGKAEEGKDYNIERLTEFWKITGEQDWKLCENNFNGIESSRYQPGPYAPVELEVAKFVEWYVERLREGVEATSIVELP